jgi:hypothetical protein
MIGSNSFGIAFVAGKNRVPKPATGKTAFVTFCTPASLYQRVPGIIFHSFGYTKFRDFASKFRAEMMV